MKPLISVIIPCYNIAKYLPKCLSSLERQTIGIEHLELIFVNDASTDEGTTWNQIMAFEAKYPESVLAVQLEKNKGLSGARNVGLQYATAPYIGFVDPDDWLDDRFYEAMYEKAKEHDCDLVKCGVIKEYSNGTSVLDLNPNDELEISPSAVSGGRIPLLSLNTVMPKLYKSNLILNNKLWFPEELVYEDSYWTKIVECYVERTYTLSNIFYHHYYRIGSIAHAKNAPHQLDYFTVQELRLEKYKELGIFERLYRDIEFDFLESYVYQALGLLYLYWDKVPYDIYCRIRDTVHLEFPDWENNPYLKLPETAILKTMLGILKKNPSKAQWEVLSAELAVVFREIFRH
ncbi:glycosyl transferase [Clostridia bacterium]|nr:glycosyl transferase [Clostridia bacterium]